MLLKISAAVSPSPYQFPAQRLVLGRKVGVGTLPPEVELRSCYFQSPIRCFPAEKSQPGRNTGCFQEWLAHFTQRRRGSRQYCLEFPQLTWYATCHHQRTGFCIDHWSHWGVTLFPRTLRFTQPTRGEVKATCTFRSTLYNLRNNNARLLETCHVFVFVHLCVLKKFTNVHEMYKLKQVFNEIFCSAISTQFSTPVINHNPTRHNL